MTRILRGIRRTRRAWPLAIASCCLLAIAGCGDSEPETPEPPPEQKMLDKLDSDDSDKFLEGVDEARDKYGTKP
jgi:hypothetical protein